MKNINTIFKKDSKSNIKIELYHDNLYCVDFCYGLEYQEYLTQYESLRNHYRDVKIALLDKEFNVIFVSQDVQLPKVDNLRIFDGEIYFDFNVKSLEFDTRVNYFYILYGGFFSIIMFISIGTETVLSLLFKFKGRRVLTIFIVNICSQVIMKLLYLVLPFTYFVEIIILELFVYTIEFLIYKKQIKDISTVKILGYTITANTLSLLLGIFIESYFFPWNFIF